MIVYTGSATTALEGRLLRSQTHVVDSRPAPRWGGGAQCDAEVSPRWRSLLTRSATLTRKCGSMAVRPPTVESRSRLLSQCPAERCFVLSEGRSSS